MNPRVVIALQVAGVTFCLAAISGSFVLSFDTWVAIGTLAGFGALAVAMPLCVDGHVMTALTTWLSPVSEQLATFARRNLYAVGAASVVAQSGYHGVIAWQTYHDSARTLLAVGAGAFPPITATLAIHLAVGIVREAFAVPEVAVTKLDLAELSELAGVPVTVNPAPNDITELEPALPAADQPRSAPLAAVPSLTADPSAVDDRQRTPGKRVTVEDVERLSGLERAEIAAQLGTSVATVDRRLRELRDRQKVSA